MYDIHVRDDNNNNNNNIRICIAQVCRMTSEALKLITSACKTFCLYCVSVLRALQKDIHYAVYCNNYDSYTHYK